MTNIPPWVWIVGVIALAVVLYLLFGRKSSSHKEGMAEEISTISPPPTKKKPSLVLFHSNSCGACKALAPAWQEFVQKASGAPADIFDRENSTFDYRTEGVKAYPTIRFYPQGYTPGSTVFSEYNGDRSPTSLLQFLANSLGLAPPAQVRPEQEMPMNAYEGAYTSHASPQQAPQAPQPRPPPSASMESYASLSGVPAGGMNAQWGR